MPARGEDRCRDRYEVPFDKYCPDAAVRPPISTTDGFAGPLNESRADRHWQDAQVYPVVDCEFC
jgi:hypothetical protein